MQNPRIIFGVEEGALTARFIQAGNLQGKQMLLSGLTADTDDLNETLLERVGSLSSPTGVVRVELPNENVVRTIHTGPAPKVPNAA